MTWIDPAAEPDFPPLLTGRRILPGTTVLDEAVRGAQAGRLGAGDVLWDSDPARVALAIVLEPDVPLMKAAQILPLAMVAAADCIGAVAPPQVGVMFRWPRTVILNGATVGALRLVSDTREHDAVPDWLVLSVDLRMRLAPDAEEPGKTPTFTTLADEGCEELTHLDVMGSFARHFLTWLNIWQDDGFRSVHRNWTERVEDKAVPQRFDSLEGEATISGMDEDGNLVLRREDGSAVLLPLLDAVDTVPEER